MAQPLVIAKSGEQELALLPQIAYTMEVLRQEASPYKSAGGSSASIDSSGDSSGDSID